MFCWELLERIILAVVKAAKGGFGFISDELCDKFWTGVFFCWYVVQEVLLTLCLFRISFVSVINFGTNC